MKLTQREIDYLKEIGEDEESIEQIKRVICNRNLVLTISKDGKEKRISYVLAKRKLGWKEFMSGIDRASFHWNCSRETKNHEWIHFDASRFFKRW